MADNEALLFANEAFYRAFADGNIRAMSDVWADDDNIACIHPGWGPLEGRDEVMGAWAAILDNPESPDLRCRLAKAFVYGNTGFVTCFEEIAGQFLIATNIFVRTGSTWRMVHHQAGPTTAEPDPEPEQNPGAIH